MPSNLFCECSILFFKNPYVVELMIHTRIASKKDNTIPVLMNAYRSDGSFERKQRPSVQGDQSSIELANYNIVEFDIKIAL